MLIIQCDTSLCLHWYNKEQRLILLAIAVILDPHCDIEYGCQLIACHQLGILDSRSLIALGEVKLAPLTQPELWPVLFHLFYNDQLYFSIVSFSLPSFCRLSFALEILIASNTSAACKAVTRHNEADTDTNNVFYFFLFIVSIEIYTL